MFRKSNIRISPATPLAMIALFVSLGSVSFAAGMIGTADLKNGASGSEPRAASRESR